MSLSGKARAKGRGKDSDRFLWEVVAEGKEDLIYRLDPEGWD